ncbi:hypothetical protein BH10CYA1_BH10CYA1_43190 [soil metagenome]
MNTLLASLSPQMYSAPDLAFTASNWQMRLVPETGVVLSDGKVANAAAGFRMLALTELEIVHALADAINSERATRIERAMAHFELTQEILEPLIAALNLELAITGRRKKYVVIENGWFKARTFSGGVVFQRTLGT